VRIVRMGYEFERAENIHKGLIQNNRKLRLEIESLKSLSHIERIARDKLGMTFPNDDQIAIIKEESLMLNRR
ncbi:MAG: cell division protein FtsL, partial [Nitrospinae bacterium]|nr:cell division protein FtsL [Nitrospinota bacterium]